MKSPHNREPMDVGLNRREKRPTVSLPPWLEENFGLLTLAAIIVVLIIVSTLLGGGSNTPTRPTSRSEQAHLVVVKGPLKAFAPGSNETLQKFSMTVKNLGPATAENVLVEGLAASMSIPLVGPMNLSVGEQAEYALQDEVTLTPGTSIVAKYVCWNCPLTPGPAPGSGEAEAVGYEKERQIMAGEHR